MTIAILCQMFPDIRAKVKSGFSIHGLVPPEVVHYIEQEHLYYEED